MAVVEQVESCPEPRAWERAGEIPGSGFSQPGPAATRVPARRGLEGEGSFWRLLPAFPAGKGTSGGGSGCQREPGDRLSLCWDRSWLPFGEFGMPCPAPAPSPGAWAVSFPPFPTLAGIPDFSCQSSPSQLPAPGSRTRPSFPHVLELLIPRNVPWDPGEDPARAQGAIPASGFTHSLGIRVC